MAYAIRTLSDREKHYSAMEKEALALVFAVKNFRFYLLGRPFQWITDNSALTWRHYLKPKGRITYWTMDLQRFSFTVEHRAGKDNANADALSRLCPSSVNPLSPIHLKDNAVCFVQLTPVFNLQDEQQKDSSLQLVRQCKSNRMPSLPILYGNLILNHNSFGIVGMACTLLMASLCGIHLFPRVPLSE